MSEPTTPRTAPRAAAEAIAIVPATTPRQIEEIRGLFKEYAASLDFSLCFQGFDAELAELPGKYAAPSGRLYLAVDAAGSPAGCAALRFLEPGICEMKRLYVRPSARGTGLGRRLAERIVADGRAIGYQRMRLDTSESMHAAQAIYRSLGFYTIPRYNNDDLEDTVFMELKY